MTGRCGTCKHWDGNWRVGILFANDRFRRCWRDEGGKTGPAFEIEPWDELDGGDGSSGNLTTTADFGCVLHEAGESA